MSPTKKTTKAKPKPVLKAPAAPKTKAAPAKQAAAPAKQAAAPAKPAAAPRGEAERKRGVPAAAAAKPKPKPKEAQAAKAPKKDASAKSRKASARAEAGRVLGIGGDAKAKLGAKYVCFKCAAKFYDLNKPEPLCPKCGADQRTRPKVDPKAKLAHPPEPRRAVARPMVPLLEEEEEEEVIVDDDLDLGLEGVEEAPDDLEEEEPEEEEPGES